MLAGLAAAWAVLATVAAAQSDSDAEPLLRSFSTLSESEAVAALGSSEALKEIVAGHRRYLASLQRTLQGSPDWGVRMAAAYAIKELGYATSLKGALRDEHPLVRNFAQGVLAKEPRIVGFGPEPPIYTVDGAYRERIDGLIRMELKLSEDQRNRRAERIIPDLLGHAPVPETVDPDVLKQVARAVARRDPAAVAAALLKDPKVLTDAERSLQALGALREFLEGDPRTPPELPASVRTLLTLASESPDSRLRVSALLLMPNALTWEEQTRLLARALEDTFSDVRSTAFSIASRLVGRLESEGRPEEADALLAALKKGLPHETVEANRETARRRVEALEEKLRGERGMLRDGAEEDGKRQRFLRVGASLVRVTDEEYEEALKQAGKPYVSDAQFISIRSAMNARTARDQRTAASGDVEAPRPPSTPAAATDPSAPPASSPAPSSSNEASPRLLIAGLGLAALLGVFWLFRRLRGS